MPPASGGLTEEEAAAAREALAEAMGELGEAMTEAMAQGMAEGLREAGETMGADDAAVAELADEMGQAMEGMGEAMAEGMAEGMEVMGEMMLVMIELGPQLEAIAAKHDLDTPEGMRAAADELEAAAALVRERGATARPEVRQMLEEMAQEIEEGAQLARVDPEAAIRKRRETMAAKAGEGPLVSASAPTAAAVAAPAPPRDALQHMPADVQAGAQTFPAELDAFEAESERRIKAVAQANDLNTPAGVAAVATEIERMAAELRASAGAAADQTSRDAWNQLAARFTALAAQLRSDPNAGAALMRTMLAD